jgi:hypothetical protein
MKKKSSYIKATLLTSHSLYTLQIDYNKKCSIPNLIFIFLEKTTTRDVRVCVTTPMQTEVGVIHSNVLNSDLAILFFFFFFRWGVFLFIYLLNQSINIFN